MIAAITVWQHRVAPVFDAAHRVVLVDVATGTPCGEIILPTGDLAQMAATLSRSQVGAVVCGAISRPASMHLLQAGCTVMACVAGDIEEVIEALRSGALARHALRLPPCPCCGHGHRGGAGPGGGHGRRRRRGSSQN